MIGVILTWYYAPSRLKSPRLENTGPGVIIYVDVEDKVMVHRSPNGFDKRLKPLCHPNQAPGQGISVTNITYHWSQYQLLVPDDSNESCFIIDKVQTK